MAPLTVECIWFRRPGETEEQCHARRIDVQIWKIFDVPVPFWVFRVAAKIQRSIEIWWGLGRQVGKALAW